MIELTDPADVRAWSEAERAAGRRLALVPTMGFLHAGHVRLIARAASLADRVVVSVFVNPLQFGPTEDFARYPRDLTRDREVALTSGVDCLFVPSEQAMYPEEPVVRVVPGALEAHLCGPHRPGHFAGVLTIVLKLLNLVAPAVAVFGRKDVQQATMIRRMAEELHVPTAIVVAPTVREPDGLALSTRNAYLSEAERRVAPQLAAALDAAHTAFQSGLRDAAELVQRVRRRLERSGFAVQYVELVDPHGLAPVAEATADSILAAAVFLGTTRLIDNIIVGAGTAGDERVRSMEEALRL